MFSLVFKICCSIGNFPCCQGEILLNIAAAWKLTRKKKRDFLRLHKFQMALVVSVESKFAN